MIVNKSSRLKRVIYSTNQQGTVECLEHSTVLKDSNNLFQVPRDYQSLYLAIVFLNELNLDTDFPIERKVLYEKYKIFCHSQSVNEILAPNIFTTVTNTVLLNKGCLVLTVKRPGNKYFATLTRIEQTLPRSCS